MSVLVNSGDWVVVCDGSKALLLENAGDEVFPNLRTKEVFEQDNPSTREQGTERPGRLQQSSLATRSAVETTDWHDEAERTFLASLAARLDLAIRNHETKAIVLVAAPRALGVLRSVLSPAVIGIVRAEIDKDYVNLTVDEIEKRVAASRAS